LQFSLRFSSLFTHCLCYFTATLLCIFSSNALAQNPVFKSPVSPNAEPQNAILQSKIENTKLSDSELRTVKDRIGQKIILDFRYFCQDNTPSTLCRTPLTEMPPELLDVLSKHNIGGIILFAENIVDAKQLVSLNYSMQKHMLQKGRPPLFIAVDQEGGRVARLPPSVLPPFAGNMAIGATFQKHGTAFAENVAQHIGNVLLPLGINTNFAPSVDVNSEPKNPVINVRSFSENPQHVAALGQAFVGAMQQTGVLSAIKHFPGHGDTHVDSHSGLPRVMHDKAKAMAGDVAPFANIINSNAVPAMVMSAHIQYPSLDSSTLVDKHGNQQIVPATLSEKILKQLLRTQLGYNGLIVTDALDMAGISQFFTPEEAMINAFNAGADIALMPYTIRNQNDIRQFSQLIDNVAKALLSNKESRNALNASLNRIAKTKQRFELQQFVLKPMSWWLNEVQENLDKRNASALTRKGEQIKKALSEASVTVLYGHKKLPLNSEKLLALMPDTARCIAFENALFQHFGGIGKALSEIQFACIPLVQLPTASMIKRLVNDTDVVIVGDITPLHANYELGGLDSTHTVKQRAKQSQVHNFAQEIMQHAKNTGKKVVFVPLRMPYIAEQVRPYTDIAIATYSYVINVQDAPSQGDFKGQSVTSEVFDALVRVLMGKIQAQGRTPVTLSAQ